MMKIFLAAAAAFVLVNAAPAYACPDCKDCPQHKVAAADKTDKKDAPAPAADACKCATAEKGPCKCGEGKCHCAHEKKEEPKKS
jgi:hypothetical protein